MGECHQDISRVVAIAIAVGILASVAGLARAQPTSVVVVYSDQGWSAADRDTFYTTSQGSRMMPYAWFEALRRADSNELFAADQLCSVMAICRTTARRAIRKVCRSAS